MKNKGNVEFKILNTNFTFYETGYQCIISLSGKISGKYTDPYNLPFSYNVLLNAKSNTYKKNMSKDQAFNSALQDFQSTVRGFIFKYEPIQIEFLRIEPNKKGKVDAVIFKKSENFLNSKRMKFVVMKTNDLSVKDNKFVISGKVGYCTFKGKINGAEIVCDVNGGKN